MTGGECLLRTLVASGIDVCFMNPGTSEMHFVSALDRVPEMRGVLGLFEGVCSGAADGYYRLARKPAATLLHLGPGLANGLSNFHNARKARSQIVSLVGEHSTQHLRFDAPLSADIDAFSRTVSDYIARSDDAFSIGQRAAEVIAAARQYPGRIATFIIPADHSWSESGPVGRAPAAPKPSVPKAISIAPENTGFILGGQTLMGKGLGLAARLAAGGYRVFADRNAARVESGRGRFQPPRIVYFPGPAQAQLAGLKNLVLVEAKAPVSFFGYPGEASYLAPADCQVQTMAAIDEDGLGALEEFVERMGLPASCYAEPEAAELPLTDVALSLDSVGLVIAALLPEGAIVSDEMVSSGPPILAALTRAKRFDYLPVTGGSIGQGMPVGVGAAIACPDRKVVVLEGDGSGMYTPQSLWTMAREGLDVLTVIFVNRRYRILDIEMKRTGAAGFGAKSNEMVDITRPDLDFVQLAGSMGVRASRACDLAQFIAHFGTAMREKGPFLIELQL
ncbi:MAG: acetolactate synthase large subunit [Acidobacteria bacterium]|nr:acetolactate synthase large subunit [Acidobacteriota bacterium]